MATAFFSRHPHQDTPEAPNSRPVPRFEVSEDLLARLESWKDELARLTRIDGEDAPRLTINQPHPGGLAQLYADHPTNLGLLVREASAHQRAIERARAILARARELHSRHGLGAIHMSMGTARWMSEGSVVSSAALLRPVRLVDQGTDVTVTLLDGYALDPVFEAALASRGLHLDLDALIARANTARGFSSSRLLSELRSAGSALEKFEIRDEIILGIFHHPARELASEFDDARHIFSSQIVRALAEDEQALAKSHTELPDSDPTDRDPWKERGAGDLTPRQLDVVEAVAKGRSFLVDVPHGADDTALIGAILADAAAYGRTTVHIGGSPSRTMRAEGRLRELGLSEAAIRLDGTNSDGSELRAVLDVARTDTAAVADAREIDDMRTRLRDVRSRLSSYTSGLHKPFRAFGVSAFDALQVLTDLTSVHPSPATRVRLREEVLLSIAQDQGVRARQLLHDASELGVFSRTVNHGAWSGVVISSPEQVPDIVFRVHRLACESIPELRVRMGAVAGQTGIESARTLRGWREQLSLFEGVRDVLDVFIPQVFEQSAADMVIATASKQWRTAHGISMKRSERIRLVKRAESFVRPGVHVPELHTQLLKVQERREAWRELTSEDGWPTLPLHLEETLELTRSIEEDLAALAPYFSTSRKDFSSMSMSDLGELFDALDADPLGAREIPERVGLLKSIAELGLSPLAADLRDRHVDEALIDSELDLAWWASILGLMLSSEPELGGFDPAQLEDTLALGRALDAEQVASLAPQALSQLRRLRVQAMATRPDQSEALPALLASNEDALDLFTALPLISHLIPIVFTVPTLVPSIVKAGHRVDLLILDEVDDLPLPELIPIIARARQVVVLADLSAGAQTGTSHALAQVLPTRTMDVAPARLNEQVALLLARHGVDHTGVPVPWTAAAAPVTAVWCEGKGMPAPGASSVESTSTEVQAVVDLVVAHAVEQPERSLGVIALNARHAERIRHAIAKLRATEPGLGGFFDKNSTQPFVVVDPSEVRGFSRDRIILSLGFAKTPHGRVIHDFGEFSTARGAWLMADVLRAVRADLTLVSSLRPQEIDRSRLSAEGAHMLLDLLEIAEGQSGVGNGGWPVLEAQPDRLLVDLADRLYGMGLEVVPNVGIPGGMRIPLAIGHPEVPGRLLVAVLTDDEAYVAEPSLRVRDRMWPAMLEAQGWKVHTALSMAVFIDPAKEAETIVQLVLDAVDEVNGPAAPPVDVPEITEAEAALEAVRDVDVDLDERLAQTSQARERADNLESGLQGEISEAYESTSGAVSAGALSARGPRPPIAPGLPLAAYSDDQLDEMAMWVRSDGVVRTREETVEELRQALAITRRGVQSDAVLSNVVRRTEPASQASSREDRAAAREERGAPRKDQGSEAGTHAGEPDA